MRDERAANTIPIQFGKRSPFPGHTDRQKATLGLESWLTGDLFVLDQFAFVAASAVTPVFKLTYVDRDLLEMRMNAIKEARCKIVRLPRHLICGTVREHYKESQKKEHRQKTPQD